MSSYEAISTETHQHKFWKPISNFNFAAQDALCSLVVEEAPKAALFVPLAFSKSAGSFGLFALQSFESGKNFLVDPEGNWRTGYIPAAYRGYPFALAKSDGKNILCINKDSGLINTEVGNSFFEESGEPNPQILQIMEFLNDISANHQTTQALCLLLEEHELIQPWPISMKKGDEEVSVDGLYRIDEDKFNALEIDKLKLMRDRGALPLIFCQLLSMQNLNRLAQWASQSASTALPEELGFDLGSSDGNISFDGM